MTSYRCISDRYDREGGTYDSVSEFLDMCRAVFGEAPELVDGPLIDGEWECYYDAEDGSGVLVEVSQ